MKNDKMIEKNIRSKAAADTLIEKAHQQAQADRLTGSVTIELCYRGGHLKYLKRTRIEGTKLGEPE